MSDQPNGAVASADVLALFQDAVKEKLRALVAIDGPTGSGKTFTALQAARILAGPDGVVAMIDTENRTALHYAAAPGEKIERVNFWDPPYVFKHLPWHPPYDPAKLTEIVKALQSKVDVIVIDSNTHFWSGEGGTLDIVDNAASRASGNSFVGWKEGSPIQRHMIDTFIHASCHVIITMRSKMEYVLEEVEVKGKDGKTRTVKQPKKIGLQPEQRAGIEYEFNVVADMDLEHRLMITKTRCSLLADRVAPKGRSAEVWADYAAWLDTGVAMPTTAQLDEMRERLNNLTPPVGGTVRQAFREKFGTKLERLTLEEFTTAVDWVTKTIVEVTAALAQAQGAERAQEPSGGDPAPEGTAQLSDDPGRVSGAAIPTAQPAYGGDAEVAPTELLGEQSPRLTTDEAIAAADYGDRIVQYVDLLPRPVLAEMCAKRGFPSNEKVDVMRARISVALVTEGHPAPTEDVLAKLRKSAAPKAAAVAG